MEKIFQKIKRGNGTRLIALFIFLLFFSVCTQAQIMLKTEYIGKSSYWKEMGDDPRQRVGDCEGSAMVYQAMANIPLSVKLNENKRPTMWSIGLGGSYASLNNKNFAPDMVSEIMNLQLAVMHLRPLSSKWSLMASVGVGVYTPFTEFSKIRYKHVLGNLGVVFIHHLRPNLDLGGGLAVNSTFGYPMAFPALYFDWRSGRKFKMNVSLGQGLELSAGYHFNDYFSLSLAGEMNGQMALVEKDGKDKIFTHQYMVAGLRPELKLGKSGLSIPVTLGINAIRPTYYSDRTLKGMFSTDNDYYFQVAPYGSVGIKFGF